MEPSVAVRSTTKKISTTKKTTNTAPTVSSLNVKSRETEPEAQSVALSAKFSAAIAFEDSSGWGDDDVDITDVHTVTAVAAPVAPKSTFTASVADSGWTNDGWDADTASEEISTRAIKPLKSKLTPAPVASSDLVNAVAVSGWEQVKSDDASADSQHTKKKQTAPTSFVAAVSDSGWGNDGWDADETSQSPSISHSAHSRDEKSSESLEQPEKHSRSRPATQSSEHKTSSKLVQDFAAAVAFEDSSGWNDDAAWDGDDRDRASVSNTKQASKEQSKNTRITTVSSKAASDDDDDEEGDWDAWE